MTDWLLEYQDGHLDEHYQATDFPDTESVIRAFQSYGQGEEGWRLDRKWIRVEL
jgi:hypothetical protein